MKTLAKSALGAAVAAAVATTSVQAAESVTMDPSLTFTYKNFYWKEDAKADNLTDAQRTEDSRDEWVHGLIADFDTGYVNDMVGAVVTAGYAGPLSVKENTKITNVAVASDGKGDAISGFQQAYLKARHTFSGVDFGGSVGVKKRSTETYSDSGSRILAASSNGFDLSAGFAGATAYFTQIDGVSGRNESTFSQKLEGVSGEEVEHLQIFGANYGYEGLSLAAEYGKAKGEAEADTVKQTFLKAGYSIDIGDDNTVDLDARYGKLDRDQDDDDSKYYNLNATLNFGNAYAGVGYNDTKDADYDDRYLGNGDNDNWNSSLALWEDFSAEGEKAYVVNAGYNFADQGLAGLSWDLWYAKGKDAEDNGVSIDGFKRREYGSYVSYAFDGSFDGLSVAWLFTDYRQDAENVKEQHDKVNRLYLTYTISAF